MGGEGVRIGPDDTQGWSLGVDLAAPSHRGAFLRVQGNLAAKAERDLPTGHRQVDIGQDLGIEQGAVQIAMTIVDRVSLAQRVETVALPWMKSRAIVRVSVISQISPIRGAPVRQLANSWSMKPTSKAALWMISSAPWT